MVLVSPLVIRDAYLFILFFQPGMPNMGAMGNAGGAGAMFTSAQELGGQMGGSMGGPMPNAFQNALGGGMPGMSQKRAKMGKVHKLFSKLSKKKNGQEPPQKLDKSRKCGPVDFEFPSEG